MEAYSYRRLISLIFNFSICNNNLNGSIPDVGGEFDENSFSDNNLPFVFKIVPLPFCKRFAVNSAYVVGFIVN